MTEEKLIYKITGIVFGLLFVATFSLACDYSYENKNLKENVSNLEKQIEEKNQEIKTLNIRIYDMESECNHE